jgi:ZIP family zinc transporter
VLSALLFGMIASSALVIGGLVGAYLRPPQRLVAVALAFASGSLITALAIDLFAEPFRTGGVWLSGIGLLAGAAAFMAADRLLDRYIEGAGSDVSGFAILAAVTLYGVPENIALGVSLLQTSWTGALALLVAIFASNLPEALGRTVSMRDQGRMRGFAVAVVAGNAVLSGASEKSLSVLLSFAGGAVLAFATATGFFVSFAISEL